MVPLLPPLKDNKKIYIICEGSEEYDYLNRLKILNVWSDVYKPMYYASYFTTLGYFC